MLSITMQRELSGGTAIDAAVHLWTAESIYGQLASVQRRDVELTD
jgi:hypothetical protein